MKKILDDIYKDSIKAKKDFFNEDNGELIIKASQLIANTFQDEKKLMLCGNGGSAADSQHIAAEFVNRFEIERRPLAAIALTTDASNITSIGNDYDFSEIFSKQVMALGTEGDTLIAISTSGTSKNVIRAVEEAKKLEMHVIGFSGGTGGDLKELSDICLTVDTKKTARIQEVHIMIGHMICALVDNILFEA